MTSLQTFEDHMTGMLRIHVIWGSLDTMANENQTIQVLCNENQIMQMLCVNRRIECNNKYDEFNARPHLSKVA